MVYEEFAPDRPTPLYRADWSGELRHLQERGYDALSLAALVVGYVWLLGQALAMHPAFYWRPLAMPFSLAALGLGLLALRGHTASRSAWFMLGSLAIGLVALLVQRLTVAPFTFLVLIAAGPLVAGPAAGFLLAGASTICLLLAAWAAPGRWGPDLLLPAASLFWAQAAVGWWGAHNLHTVLHWALRGYEESWNNMRELQVQRAKLRRTMRDLADANALLKRTTYDLAAAREEAERARQMKSRFAANISHELRTPLHLIVGFSQMMYASPESYEGVRWTPELRADIQEIYESAQHLLRLIDDVLDLAQIDAARLPLSKEKVNLAPLIADAVETARSLLRGRDLYLRLEVPQELPPLYADPTRIRQVLLNLLNNAARFTERGGITVRAFARSDEVEVVVEDTGVGIPPDQLKDIFSEFYQIDGSLRRKYGGTGLGLAICREFVSLHGGRIWAESEVGKGSTFHFTLPLPNKALVQAQEAKLPAGWRYPAARPQRPWRLITLSEPPEFPRLLRRYLPDVEVLEAPDVPAAARLAREAQADMAILSAADDEDASCARALAEATADIYLPVVSCSLPLERHLALAEGFDQCLMKPFTADQLLQVLRRAAPQLRTLLVVDDDPAVGRLVRRSLRAAGIAVEVWEAYDGEEALSLLLRRPDVLLLDLILPKMDGLQVLHWLRERSWGKELPVVAITAYGFQRDVASLGQGLVAVRRGKHFSALELTQWLNVALGTVRARHLQPYERVPEPAPGPSA
jgi:signal transduction histidine kinase/CheY-like chemotaxis protein